MKKAKNAPPGHLRTPAKALWARLREDYCIDDAGGLALLEATCASYQRCEEARALIGKEGLTTVDRFGQTRAHPGIAIERDSRGQMISALRALKLAPTED